MRGTLLGERESRSLDPYYSPRLKPFIQAIKNPGITIKGSNVTSLDLRDNYLYQWGAELMAAFGDALAGSKVTLLDLRSNNLGYWSAKAMAAFGDGANVKCCVLT